MPDTPEFNDGAMLKGAIDCAIGALQQELDTLMAVGSIEQRATRAELVTWLKGFDRDRREEQLSEILARRNSWALKLGTKTPAFWSLVLKELGIADKP